MRAKIVVDLGFGDAGKGRIVHNLTKLHHSMLNVRFNGGAQAAHNVQDGDKKHTFHQFGSGTFHPGTKTYYSKYALFDSAALLTENEELIKIGINDALSRFYLDEEALVVTPLQIGANRFRETVRGNEFHGSCGMGIGETMYDQLTAPTLSIRAKDIKNGSTIDLFDKLKVLREWKWQDLKDVGVNLDVGLMMYSDNALHTFLSYCEQLRDKIHFIKTSDLTSLISDTTIFEGAQGILLDEWFGFHPYTTWSTTTSKNARMLLSEIGFTGKIETIGVTRTYTTRHGPGPFPTEDPTLLSHLDPNNPTGKWQKHFRVGHFDHTLFRYALGLDEIDCIALTHLDKLEGIKACHSYDVNHHWTPRLKKWYLEQCCSQRVCYILPPILEASQTDLDEQEELTKDLLKVKPEYMKITDIPGMIRMMRNVKYESFGPDARDFIATELDY